MLVLWFLRQIVGNTTFLSEKKNLYMCFTKTCQNTSYERTYLAISTNILAYISNFVVSTFHSLELRCESTIIKYIPYTRYILSSFWCFISTLYLILVIFLLPTRKCSFIKLSSLWPLSLYSPLEEFYVRYLTLLFTGMLWILHDISNRYPTSNT